MIDTVKQLCQLLESSSVTSRQVAESLGTLTEEGGENVPSTVKPNDPTLAEARVVDDSGQPSWVELDPSDGDEPTIAALEAAFGSYTRIPRIHWNNPERVVFYPRSPRTPYTCAVIAEVSPGTRGVEDGTATRLTVRRDRRLD
jgi:hypothetical protein